MSKGIILHIGHGKTGTSYLQSVLANNTDILLEKNILYPEHPSFHEAKQGFMSFGNGSLIQDPDYKFDQNITYLLSSENLFHDLCSDPTLQKYVFSKFENIKVILYTRDLFELLFSVWAQHVKSAGEIKNLNDFLIKINDTHHTRVLWWIKASNRFGFEIIVRNYSRHSEHLLERFIDDVMQVDRSDINVKLPAVQFVNRSLTPVEIEVQRLMNFVTSGSDSSRYISVPLIKHLPNYRAKTPRIQQRTYDTVLSRYQPVIDEINGLIHPKEEIKIVSKNDICDYDDHAGQYELTDQQIYVLGSNIRQNLAKNHIKKQHINNLRDIAIKIEKKQDLTLDDALTLMEIAQSARPNGDLINAKIQEWNKKLGA